MRYGACNWIFGGEDLNTTAAFLAKAGFDGVELKGDLQLYQPAEVARILGDHGLSVLSMTPEDVDLPHPDPKVRAEAVDYYLRLLDLAAALDAPLISCHGAVGRIRALANPAEEYGHFVAGVRRIAERAAQLQLRVAMEVLNRYESHLLNTAAQALRFVQEVGAPNVGVLLDAYHMNIEEADPVGAVMQAGRRLFVFHAADSNRQAVGRGHTDFLALVRALRRIGFDGDVVVECTASGPDPFTPVKGPSWRAEVRQYAAESLRLLRAFAESTQVPGTAC